MPIEVDCSSCGQRLRAPDSAAGKAIRCPHCQNVMDLDATAAGPHSATAMRDAWRVKAGNGAEYGPVPKSELDQWVRDGRVDASTQILQEGASQWQLASSVYPQLAGGHAPSPSSRPASYSASTSTNPFADQTPSTNPYSAGTAWTNTSRAATGPQPLSGGVIAVAVCNFIIGGLSLLGGLCLMVASGGVPMWGRDIAVFMMLLIVALGVLYVVGGIGLLQRAEWGRVVTFVMAGLNILGIIFSLVGLVNAMGHGADEVVFSQLISIVIAVGYVILVFAVLTSSNVTQEFRAHREQRYRR